jgi:hypothetical protein
LGWDKEVTERPVTKRALTAERQAPEDQEVALEVEARELTGSGQENKRSSDEGRRQ